MEIDTVSILDTRDGETMNYKEADYDNEEYDDDDDEKLLLSVPQQSNQSCSIVGAKYHPREEKKIGETLLVANYMYRTMVMDQAINSSRDTFIEVMRGKRSEEMIRLGDLKPVPKEIASFTSKEGDQFVYDPTAINKEQIEVQTNCEWLDCRLEIHQIVKDSNVPLEQLISHLKSSFINVANDLMIFYHTHSDFALQLIKMESFNLLTILKEPRLENVVSFLIDGFSKYLLSIIKDSSTLDNDGKKLGITIPSVVEILMSNYGLIQQKKISLKARFNAIPKVVFYSFYAPSYIVMNGNRINSILDKRIISLQRKYFCKVILDGPFLKDTPSTKKIECFRFDVFLDYNFNYWIIIKNELLKWMHSFVRSMFQCNIDKICISFVAQDFFCCDEIQNLMKRQHLLRDVDINFVKVIKWSKMNQVDRAVL